MIQDTAKETKCDTGTFRRVLYFHGMLLDEKDFILEQTYHIEKRKSINRMLHGWGVVCGLDLVLKQGGKSIEVKQGMALDCHGNEILVCEPVEINLAEMSLLHPQTNTDECQEPKGEGKKEEYFLGIRYNEESSTPVPAYVTSSSCEKSSCKHSRVQEGFCIKILDQCESHQPSHEIPVKESICQQLCGAEEYSNQGEGGPCESRKTEGEKENANDERCRYEVVPCPDCCPEEHFIILGKITLNSDLKTVKSIDINECRKYVWSSSLFKYTFFSLFGCAKNVPAILKCMELLFELLKKVEIDLEDTDKVAEFIYKNPIALLCKIESQMEDLKKEIDTLKKKERKRGDRQQLDSDNEPEEETAA